MKRVVILGAVIFLSLIAPVRGRAWPGADGPRNFVLLFDILDYTKEMGDAVAFFFNDILAADDQLIVYSPGRAYGFSKNTLAKPKRELIASMKENLRGDSAACSSNFRVIFNSMKDQARAIEGGRTTSADGLISLKNSLTMYRQEINSLQSLRKINEPLLVRIVDMFKTQPGRNHMIMIYQAEFRPIPNKETLSRLRAVPEIAFQVAELFASDDQPPPLDASKFAEIFLEAKVTFHLLYIKPKDISSVQDFKEHSADMFDVFSKIAKATGGITETTASPEAALKSVKNVLGESPD